VKVFVERLFLYGSLIELSQPASSLLLACSLGMLRVAYFAVFKRKFLKILKEQYSTIFLAMSRNSMEIFLLLGVTTLPM
jgi:hypothetical protein